MNGAFSPEALAAALRALSAAGLDLSPLTDEWLTVPEAMVAAGVSRTRLYEWMRDGLPFLDEVPRQIRRSALLQFKADREVVMVRDKKVPAVRAAAKLPQAKAPSEQRTGTARPSVCTSDGTDRASLLALLKESRKAAA